MIYSNSSHDQDPTAKARQKDESAVRGMYELQPYPDLGADLKDARVAFAAVLKRLGTDKPLRFLDVGCGTGHLLIGAAMAFPQWRCHGIDLSDASLAIARQLADKHNVSVDIRRGSYLDPLPFDTDQFDLISAQGTIHHSADPVAAMRELRKALSDDGLMSMHMYGWRLDQRKFEIKEMLSIFEPDLGNYGRRFELYQQLMRHEQRWTLRRLLSYSPLDVYAGIKHKLRDWRRRRRNISWSPPWTARYREVDAPWVDHFCHPVERAYEVPDLGELIRESGFEVVEMLRQGREAPTHLPPEWREPFVHLDPWQRYRLMELLSPSEMSFSLVLKKAIGSPPDK